MPASPYRFLLYLRALVQARYLGWLASRRCCCTRLLLTCSYVQLPGSWIWRELVWRLSLTCLAIIFPDYSTPSLRELRCHCHFHSSPECHQLAHRCQKLRAHILVMRRRMVLGGIIHQVLCALPPIKTELPLDFSVSQPVEALSLIHI